MCLRVSMCVCVRVCGGANIPDKKSKSSVRLVCSSHAVQLQEGVLTQMEYNSRKNIFKGQND